MTDKPQWFDNLDAALGDKYEGRVVFRGDLDRLSRDRSIEAACESYDTLEGDVIVFDCIPGFEFWPSNMEGEWRAHEH